MEFLGKIQSCRKNIVRPGERRVKRKTHKNKWEGERENEKNCYQFAIEIWIMTAPYHLKVAMSFFLNTLLKVGGFFPSLGSCMDISRRGNKWNG